MANTVASCLPIISNILFGDIFYKYLFGDFFNKIVSTEKYDTAPFSSAITLIKT